MITASELYEAGFCSSEHLDTEIRYVEFSKFINGFEIQVTHEVVGDVVELCYVELGLELSYRKIALESIDQIKQLELLLNTGNVTLQGRKEKVPQLNLFK